MSKIRIFPVVMFALCVLCLAMSCVTETGVLVATKTVQIKLDTDIVLTVKTIKDGMRSVSVRGNTFSPKNSDYVICSVSYSIANNSAKTYDYSKLQNLCMLILDISGKFLYVDWTKPQSTGYGAIGLGAGFSSVKIDPGAVYNDTVYYLHSKSEKLAALSFERRASIMIAPETDPSYAKIDEYVKRQEAVQMIFTLSGFMNYNIVKEMLDKNGIDINEKNYNGLTLLYAAIFSKNDSLLTGLIKDGADLYVTAYYMTFYKVVPLHMAVFTLNEFAVDELVKAGVSLNYKAEGIEEPAVMAVRLGLSKAVKLLMDRGVDFTTLMIPMANTGPIPALKFATDRKLTEIVALIEGQKK